MKNTQLRKILFLSNTNIALVVFDIVDGQKNIWFANEVELSGADLKVKINELVTNAANFLDFNIKDVEIVFDDSDVKNITCKNELYDCNNEEEITKGIYKIAKLNNHYVNEISFNNIIYDDIEKKAIVDYEIVASVYTTYNKFIKAVRECNISITNSTNLYTLINNKNASSQAVIRLFDHSVTASQYALGKLNNVVNFPLEADEVYTALANKFNQSKDSIKQMISIVNNIGTNFNNETLISLSFDFIHKKFSGIKIGEFVESYQAEVNYLLSNKINLNEYSEVSLITNNEINQLPNAKVIKFDEIIGLERISNDKVLALNNIDVNSKANTQFKFENTINSKIHALTA